MEHRTSPDDLVPPWYKRGAYIMIIIIVAFILIYATYLLLSPHSPASTYVNNSIPNPYNEGYNP